MSIPPRKQSLPAVSNPAAYDALPSDHPAYLSFAAELARAIGPSAIPERLAGGSLPVYALGPTAVLKLYPPCFASEGPREAAVLETLAPIAAIPSPALRADGERDGWRYVVMDRLPGRLWSAIDDELTPAARGDLAQQLGLIAAALHRVAARFEWPERAWAEFEAGQRDGAVARQQRLGLDAHWLAQITPFLDRLGPSSAAHVLLHTELMRQHAFVQPSETGWQISGIFDFEPARIGPAGYDLASVGLFVAAGDARLMHAFLDGYGLPPAQRTLEWQRRCLGWALLHEYSHLPWYLDRLPAPAARTLDDLARRWWPL